jgi:hypothetical protein
MQTLTIRAYVESHYPAIYLVTHEEKEADDLIADLSEGRKIVEWNMAQGLVNFKTKRPLSEWCDLAAALDNLLAWDFAEAEHTIVIRDAHLGLKDQPVAVARLKALINKILLDAEATVTVFLVSSQTYIPRELEKFITVFDLPLPNEQDIREVIHSYAEAYEQTISDDDVTTLALAFQGLTRYEIGQLLNRGYQRSGNIGIEDLDLVHSEKAQIIKKSGILEIYNRQLKIRFSYFDDSKIIGHQAA